MSNRPAYIGSDHADDILMMQGAEYTGKVGEATVHYTEDDSLTASLVFKAWTNFGRTGYKLAFILDEIDMNNHNVFIVA